MIKNESECWKYTTRKLLRTEGMNGLRDIMPELDKRFRYAVEVS